ncbi:MAG: hypothetical protein A2Z25_01175 [Planctomycetes bacterium RBG_16_55_9]|nr:MAG: hypothetical protein A2Z25_01175 [Planctomycetes bacterium RBG_16_55_9]
MKELVVVIIIAALLVLVGIRFARTRSKDLPKFTNKDISTETRVGIFVTDFIRRDPQASQLLNPSNMSLFAQGYRPKIGIPHDPEANGQKYTDIQKYFTKKLYLDLTSIHPLNQSSFQSFVDQVGRWADQTIICAGNISVKYVLNVEGRFNFETELAKVPDGPEREEFKQCWLNDFIISTELRILAWIYVQLFNSPYVTTEKR